MNKLLRRRMMIPMNPSYLQDINGQIIRDHLNEAIITYI